MYLLFISYHSGLMHNSLYKTIEETYDSILQLLEEESLVDNVLTIGDLQKQLVENDDFYLMLSNGTWFHLQMQPVFSLP